MCGFQDITDQQFAILAFYIMGMFSRQKKNKDQTWGQSSNERIDLKTWHKFTN